jgi:hypothetical protein
MSRQVICTQLRGTSAEKNLILFVNVNQKFQKVIHMHELPCIQVGHRIQLTKLVLPHQKQDVILGGKILICLVRNVFYGGKTGTSASQTEFAGAQGQRTVKSIKLGLSWENWDEWDP